MVKNFLFKIANEHNFNLKTIPLEQSNFLRNDLYRKYKVENRGLFLWDSYIPNSYLSNREDSWLGLDDFIQSKETIIFFDQKVEANFFELLSGQSIVSLLENYKHDEYYLTNRNLDFLICCTDLGHLVAAGTARDWLEKQDLAVSSG
ncbi:MAG TPA: hypothetical protein PK079_17760 [Leptospiraceae bacterium]|nr:hypothetical protein [Leptospiraceae bacterium]HMX32170.1 hypothetical protein [Leptospiraceae bacterium]HMY32240.1 hypothetical protein [Leptospiraceae bacterium]HMZ63930.1 hypothetical protein [Leptospiraceae bacterium]HNA09730.1 hypothetical protein [Leptospiraceae bacterium]